MAFEFNYFRGDLNAIKCALYFSWTKKVMSFYFYNLFSYCHTPCQKSLITIFHCL